MHSHIYNQMNSITKFVLVPKDVAKALAVCALNPAQHNGKKMYYDIGPTLLKESECTILLSQHLGKQINYVDIPNENLIQPMLVLVCPSWWLISLMPLRRLRNLALMLTRCLLMMRTFLAVHPHPVLTETSAYCHNQEWFVILRATTNTMERLFHMYHNLKQFV